MSIIWVPDDYATIQAAVTAAITGDTILVRDGVYHEEVQVPAGKDYLRIIAVGEKAVLDGRSLLAVAISLSNTGAEIKGFSIKNYNVGIIVGGFTADGFHRVINNCISDIDSYGIRIIGNGNLVWKNKILRIGRVGINAANNFNWIIENILADNAVSSFAAYEQNIIADVFSTAVINNLFANSGAGVGLGFYGNIFLYKNKILGNCVGGVDNIVDSSVNASVFVGNEVADNKGKGISLDGISSIVYQNWIHDNDRSGIDVNGVFNIIEKNTIFKNFNDGINVRQPTFVNKNLIGWNCLRRNVPYDIDLNNPDNTVIFNKCRVSDPPGLCSNSPGGAANVIHVPDDYATIQLAVTAAQPGDVILVEDGVYSEEVTVSNGKSNIRIIALCKNAILDGMNSLGTAFTLQGAAGVEIKGFKIRDYTAAGIMVNGNTNFPQSSFNRLLCNSLTNTGIQGILLINSQGNLILQNSIEGTANGLEITTVSPGIGVSFGNWIVENNLVNNTSNGIAITSSGNNGIVRNCVYSNASGISTTDSSNTLIIYNKVSNQSANGLEFTDSPNSVILENVVENNQEDGISKLTSNNGIISENKVLNNNGTGVELSGSAFNIIEQNKINGNQDSGVVIDAASTNNLVIFNSICNNQPEDIVRSNPDNDVIFNECENSNPPGLCDMCCK